MILIERTRVFVEVSSCNVPGVRGSYLGSESATCMAVLPNTCSADCHQGMLL